MASKERGLICTGEIVRAFLDDRKTQTRRIIKGEIHTYHKKGDVYGNYHWHPLRGEYMEAYEKDTFLARLAHRNPYGKVGDRLWVRETTYGKMPDGQKVVPLTYYKADDTKIILHFDGGDRCPVGWNYKAKTLSARYMQKRFARIWREIAGVRVERVQDISEEDAIAEGVIVGSSAMGHVFTAKEHFKGLWDSINAKRGYGWEVNPFVWVLDLERLNDGK